MKAIKFFAVVTALVMCTTMSAQFTNTGSKSKSVVNTNGWQSVYVQYSPTTLVQSEPGAKDVTLNLTGLSVGYERAIGLTKDIPLYLNIGGNLKYSFGKDKGDDKYTFLSVKVPVSVSYDFSVTENIDILPYAGLFFRYNIIGKLSFDGEDDSNNLFSDSDDYDNEEQWKRFQIGWQIGANVMFNKKFYAGVGYSSDLGKLFDGHFDGDDYSIKSHAINLRLGLVF